MNLADTVTIDKPGHAMHGRTGLVVGLVLHGDQHVAHIKVHGGLTVALPVDALRVAELPPELPDTGMVGSDHPDTAQDAARKIGALPIARHRRAILRALASAPTGLTAEELEARTGLGGNTIRPRLVELSGERRNYPLPVPYVRLSGRTRPTKRRRQANVYVITDAGSRALAEADRPPS